MKELNLNQEHLDHVMREYEPLLCSNCKEALRKACEPIAERMNQGKAPAHRHLVKLLRCLCYHCQIAVIKKKQNC